MFDIHILLPNTPGALAALAGLLGRNGIGLEGVVFSVRAVTAMLIFWLRTVIVRGRSLRRKVFRYRMSVSR